MRAAWVRVALTVTVRWRGRAGRRREQRWPALPRRWDSSGELRRAGREGWRVGTLTRVDGRQLLDRGEAELEGIWRRRRCDGTYELGDDLGDAHVACLRGGGVIPAGRRAGRRWGCAHLPCGRGRECDGRIERILRLEPAEKRMPRPNLRARTPTQRPLRRRPVPPAPPGGPRTHTCGML